MTQFDKNFNDDFKVSLAIHPQSHAARGQVQFCYNLIANINQTDIFEPYLHKKTDMTKQKVFTKRKNLTSCYDNMQ